MYNQALGVCRGLAFWVMGWLLSGYCVLGDGVVVERLRLFDGYHDFFSFERGVVVERLQSE